MIGTFDMHTLWLQQGNIVVAFGLLFIVIGVFNAFYRR